MHYIQSKIIDKLLYAQSLRYSQLKPADIESNHFAYHLKSLLRDKYVLKKSNNQYALAPKGLSYVETLSHERMNTRQQPVITTMQNITNDRGETLCFKRAFQPYFGLIMLPSGKLHMNEDVESAAKRELLEKTGLSDVALRHRGIVYITIRQDGYVISTIVSHIFSGVSNLAITDPDTKKGSRLWLNTDIVPAAELYPALRPIQKLLKGEEFFFEELYFDL